MMYFLSANKEKNQPTVKKLRRRKQMRKILREQVQMGEMDIAAIAIELDSRDEIPQLLRGLQYIYTAPALRRRIFDILLELVPDDVRIDTGRSGMDLWKIFVLGTIRLNCKWDYDKLQEIANNHLTLRRIMGHGLLDMETRYPRQTLCDNIRWFTPEILDKINKVVVEAGHRVLGIAVDAPLTARCDSFVVETDVHFPTDINLLWDAARKVLKLMHQLSNEVGIDGWRQALYLIRKVKRLFRAVQKVRDKEKDKTEASAANKAATRIYIDTVGPIMECALESIKPYQRGNPEIEAMVEQIVQFCDDGKTLIGQIKRRCFKGEKIPHEGKIFSLFERHTEWIVKGKAGISQELGLRVAIVECSSGFVLHHRIMEQETDEEIALPIIKDTKARFKSLNACSFDKGFHSPENQEQLAKLLGFCVLPKKGKLDGARREYESSEGFKELRRTHAAVESGINALEHHGLDRVLDYGLEGFERYVALSIVARNIQLLGRKLQEKELKAQQARERFSRRAA
jgi:transposase, IS5 family